MWSYNSIQTTICQGLFPHICIVFSSLIIGPRRVQHFAGRIIIHFCVTSHNIIQTHNNVLCDWHYYGEYHAACAREVHPVIGLSSTHGRIHSRIWVIFKKAMKARDTYDILQRREPNRWYQQVSQCRFMMLKREVMESLHRIIVYTFWKLFPFMSP